VKAPRSLRHFNALCRTPIQAQEDLLRQILETNADTEFGRRYGFGAVTSFQQFQERVPISAYEDLEPYITAEMQGRPNQLTKDPPVLFTTTSGTTGKRKYIPMTREGKRAKAHLTWLWFCGLYRDHPGIVGGRILSVVSPRSSPTLPAASRSGPSPGTATGLCPDR
jgi:GH3 auxin-responsive promoter